MHHRLLIALCLFLLHNIAHSQPNQQPSAQPAQSLMSQSLPSTDSLAPDTAVANASVAPLALPSPVTTGSPQACLFGQRNFATARQPLHWAFPATLFALGISGSYDKGLFGKFRHFVQQNVAQPKRDYRTKMDDFAQYAPAFWHTAIGLIPAVKKHNNFTSRALALASSYATLGILVNVGKYSFGELRPDSTTRNSFPSGHTSTAFMGAELLRMEYGNTIGTCAYTVATLVGIGRIYNNRHWVNDVLAGAAIGIFSARVGYWLMPLERQLLRKLFLRNRAPSAAPTTDPTAPPRPTNTPQLLLLPNFEAGSGSAGLSLHLSF